MFKFFSSNENKQEEEAKKKQEEELQKRREELQERREAAKKRREKAQITLFPSAPLQHKAAAALSIVFFFPSEFEP